MTFFLQQDQTVSQSILFFKSQINDKSLIVKHNFTFTLKIANFFAIFSIKPAVLKFISL